MVKLIHRVVTAWGNRKPSTHHPQPSTATTPPPPTPTPPTRRYCIDLYCLAVETKDVFQGRPVLCLPRITAELALDPGFEKCTLRAE